MATLTIGLSGSGVANGSKNYTIGDPATTKLVAWGRTAYPVTPDTRTDGQVLVAIFDAYVGALKAAVTKVDRDAAVAAAAASTPDVVIG